MSDTPAAVIAAALALVSPNLTSAQEQALEGYHEAADDQLVVDEFNLTVEELEDTDVLTSAGEVAGEVEDVLLDASGRPVALTVEVGGVLGLGAEEVVIGIHQLRQDRDGLVSELSTEEQFQALPKWED